MSHINTAVPGAREYYPLNEPEIGTFLGGEQKDLFKPLEIKGLTFKNRIFVSPMCQYRQLPSWLAPTRIAEYIESSSDGHATDWHLVHIGGFATRGVGAICLEATAVVPEGRISPEDAGLWQDSQIAPLKRIVEFSHSQGTKIGIQLAHAGRKASSYAPWVQMRKGRGTSRVASQNENGWPDNVYAPSAIPFSEITPQPKEMTEEDMLYVENTFVAAAKRCKQAGSDFIEIHGAHGYLISEFVSPLSNTRTDKYGGSPSNRLRFPTRLLQRVRAEWSDKPLFVRISATDWAEGPEKAEDGTWMQWGVEQCNLWVDQMLSLGLIDLLDVSSGGNWAKQTNGPVPNGPVEHGYQVPFAEAIKKAHPALVVGAVGAITKPEAANSYLKTGKADVIFMGRELLRNPHWPLMAAKQLGARIKPANQYSLAWLFAFGL